MVQLGNDLSVENYPADETGYDKILENHIKPMCGTEAHTMIPYGRPDTLLGSLMTYLSLKKTEYHPLSGSSWYEYPINYNTIRKRNPYDTDYHTEVEENLEAPYTAEMMIDIEESRVLVYKEVDPVSALEIIGDIFPMFF